MSLQETFTIEHTAAQTGGDGHVPPPTIETSKVRQNNQNKDQRPPHDNRNNNQNQGGRQRRNSVASGGQGNQNNNGYQHQKPPGGSNLSSGSKFGSTMSLASNGFRQLAATRELQDAKGRFVIINYSNAPFGYGFRLSSELILAAILGCTDLDPVGQRSVSCADAKDIHATIAELRKIISEPSSLTMSIVKECWSVSCVPADPTKPVVQLNNDQQVSIATLLHYTLELDIRSVFEAIYRQADVNACNVNIMNIQLLALFACHMCDTVGPAIKLLAHTIGMSFKSLAVVMGQSVYQHFANSITQMSRPSERITMYTFYGTPGARDTVVGNRQYRLAPGRKQRGANDRQLSPIVPLAST